MYSSIDAKPNSTGEAARSRIRRLSDVAIRAVTALSKDRDGNVSLGDATHSDDERQQKLIDTQWEHYWSL